MKKISNLLFSSILFFGVTLNAQEKNEVSQSEKSISGLSGNALSVEINRASQEKIIEEWEDVMDDYDGKTEVSGNQVHATEVEVEEISAEKIEVAARVEKISETKSAFLVIFFSGGKAISSTNSPAGFVAAKNIVQRFAKRISQEATEEYQEAQGKILEELNDELEDLNDDQEDAKKEIEDSEEKIEEAKEDKKEAQETIEENKEEKTELEQKQDALNKKIKDQQKVLDGAKQEKKEYK